MSKTRSLKKLDVVADDRAGKITFEETAPAVPALVQPFTAAQLAEMLRAAQISEGLVPVDPTMDLPTGEIPAHLIADKSALPPLDARGSAPAAQLPGKAHGSFGINGIPLLVPQLGDAPVVPAGVINPATGSFYTQIGPRPATQISPPPSRRFDGR